MVDVQSNANKYLKVIRGAVFWPALQVYAMNAFLDRSNGIKLDAFLSQADF
jgi:hypothetical protein